MDPVTSSLQTAIQGWATALAADSASPQPSYAINGKQVGREEWREGLEKLIRGAQETINARNPYFIVTRAYAHG